MDEPITYNAYLEVGQDGHYTGRILDLAGCFATGVSKQDALAALTAAIPLYYAWLKRHDEYTPEVRGPWRVVPAETFPKHRDGNHEVGAFFTPDAAPVDDEDLAWYLALLGWAHDDLVALARSLPPTALEARAPSGGWSVREVLAHLTATQLYYLTRLDASPERVPAIAPDADPVTTMARAHTAAVARLRDASDEQRTAVREHQGERWSMRKVLRQSIWHVCDHASQIQRIVGASAR